MAEFKTLETLEFPNVGVPVTDENLYWKKLGVRIKSYGVLSKIWLLKIINATYCVQFSRFSNF